MKLNTLLAKTDHSSSQFKKLISDYVAFFKTNQSAFKGIRKTYAPKEGTVDEPSMRGNISVVTTVGEKLKWLEENTQEHIDNLFSVEATNASGAAKAELTVDGVSFGTLSSLELLRLKSVIENGDLESLYSNIPVRSDSDIWDEATDSQYTGRKGIFEGPEQKGTKKSIVKQHYILEDPNVKYLTDTSKYIPQVGQKDTIIDLGDYTVQSFTGEYSHRQRAEILARRSKLLNAVIEALKVANEAEAQASSLTAKKILGYLHGK